MKWLASTVCVLAIAIFSVTSYAANGSFLKLPPGAKVAIVVFEDLECPDCAKAYPVLYEAAKKYNIPLVVHEFPLPKHSWAFDGAVYALFFAAKSETLGDLFRAYIYLNQRDITPQNLRKTVETFARDNKLSLPSEVDPEGKLKESVQSDYKLGQFIGLEYTPTIFVINGVMGGGGLFTEYSEVKDRSQINQIIEERLKRAFPATPKATASQRAEKRFPI